MKTNSLKIKFRNTFVKIIALSLIATIITFFIYIFFFNAYLYPASYFEDQIPKIKEFVDKNNDYLLDPNSKSSLETVIPLNGMDYQIIDMDNNIIYASTDKTIITNKKDLTNNLNKTISHKNNFFSQLIPITDSSGLFKGAILLNYQLEPKARSANKIYPLLAKYSLFIPIVYVILFTIYYSSKLSREISRPLNSLMDAVYEIKNKNLDFSIVSDSNNEIGELSNALEDMRLELKLSLEEQWQLEDRRKENLSNIAHDLKTPLTIISTYSEALLNKNLDSERQVKYIRTINENNKRAINMISDMNQLINLENPNYSLEPISLNIFEYFESKLPEYKEVMYDNSISYTYQIIDKRETKLEGLYDIKAINQVLDNIISNSIRFSKNESIEIRLTIFNDYFNITVADTGQGFSREDLKYLFDKFYRGDKSRSSKTGNSGLGMFISKKFVHMHKGHITARNNSPKGAIIELNIYSL